RSEAVTLRDQGVRNALVGGIYQASGRVRKYLRLLTQVEGGDLVVLLRPVLHEIPSNSKIESQTRSSAPTVLVERGSILVTGIIGLRVCLVVEGRNSNQEVSQIRSSFGSVEGECTVEGGIWIYVDLFITHLEAGFHGVGPQNLREIVRRRIGVIGLRQIGDRCSEGNRVQCYVLDSQDVRSQRHYPRGS